MTDINPDYDTIKQPLKLTGACYCRNLTYHLKLEDVTDAKTALCHCVSCKKAFGGAFGLTTRVPIQAFRYDAGSGRPTIHAADNGMGSTLYREFCSKCGSHICEYGEQAKEIFRSVVFGSLDEPSALPPKGEWFCSQREDWMPVIPGTFQKWEHEE